jgi:hypothetical protein
MSHISPDMHKSLGGGHDGKTRQSVTLRALTGYHACGDRNGHGNKEKDYALMTHHDPSPKAQNVNSE